MFQKPVERVPQRLICEGPCNGGAVEEFDEIVANSLRVPRHAGIFVSRDWLLLARNFIYTLHRPDALRDHMTCVVCGTIRRYGRSLRF